MMAAIGIFRTRLFCRQGASFCKVQSNITTKSRTFKRLIIHKNPHISACYYSNDSKNPGSYTFLESVKNKEKSSDHIPGAGDSRPGFEVLKDSLECGEEGLEIPRETDILIIGGGAFGASVAYHLKQRAPGSFSVTVVERDPTYTQASTVLSVGGIRQQFSLPENVQMSLYSAEFIRNIKKNLSILGMEPPDVNFNHQGYLFLASEAGQETLRESWETQTQEGAKVDLMQAEELKRKFPWLNTSDIALGSYGQANEGWFDPWLFLGAMRNKATSLGAKFVKAELFGFTFEDFKYREGDGTIGTRKRLDTAEVRSESGQTHSIRFAICINCAGPWAGEVGRMANIGTGDLVLSVPIPIEPRKRYVYVVHCPEGPGIEMPMIVDSSGAYIRREGMGGHYICGITPPESEEPPTDNLDVDFEFFNEKVWPHIAKRVPCFESLKAETNQADLTVDHEYFKEVLQPLLVKRIPIFEHATVKSAWSGYYDYNYFDENLIIGNHPYHNNFYIAAGASGHGIQHAPAVGRAIMERILDNEYTSIDLSRLNFDRVLDDEPVYEKNIV